MILSLSIFLTLAALTPLMFSAIFSTSLKTLHYQEISLFFEQADKEIQGSVHAESRWNRLYLLQSDGNEVTYEKNGERIVRKVNGKGFEIILQKVNDFKVIHTQYSVQLLIHSLDQEYEHKTILVQPYANQWRNQ